MTAVERIAHRLGEYFAALEVPAMARHSAFRQAVEGALAVLAEEAVVARVVAQGPLTGARNPHAVIVARLRQLPALEAGRRRLMDENEEARRWAAVDRAARRGETLRALVERGDLFADEAGAMLSREFEDDDLRGLAAAALAGGQT